jgi:hypothetical protein
MSKLKVGDFVEWLDGRTRLTGKIWELDSGFASVYCHLDRPYMIPISKLTFLSPLSIDKENYKKIARFDIDAESFFNGNAPENIINVDGCKITVEDFLAGLEGLTAESFDNYSTYLWLTFVAEEIERIGGQKQDSVYDETDALNSMISYVRDPWGEMCPEGLSKAVDEGRVFVEDRGKTMLERRYPIYVKERLIERFEEAAVMNSASEELLALYRRFAEELAAENNKHGLNAVGYGCYGGDRAFACDWERSRNCITRFFEIEDEMPKKAFLANTLGYIYYYGRCNGGVPEYEEAYKYFSFAAFNGVYESLYKIADMYKNGYGVPKSKATSDNIICDLYDKNLKYIEDCEFDCKFADVALRMGGICEEDERCGCESALYYYMQADFAIRMRMQQTNYYGDAKVCDAISMALERIKSDMDYRPKRSVRYYSLEGLLGAFLKNGKLDLVIKKQKDLKYKMTFSIHKEDDDRYGKKMFVTLPAIDFCGMLDKISVTYEAHEELDETLLGKALVIDRIRYHNFRLVQGEEFAAIGSFVLKNGTKPREKKHRFVSVSFGTTQKLYDYLCDDESVQVGDSVTVMASGEEEEVLVCRVFEKSESETSLPIKAYKRVLRKI